MDQLVSRMKRHEDVTFDPAEPRSPVQELFMLALTDQLSIERVKPLVAATTSFRGFEGLCRKYGFCLKPDKHRVCPRALFTGVLAETSTLRPVFKCPFATQPP
jgi:hypothetical protein